VKYYLDTEFNSYLGELISLALIREDGKSLYMVYPALPAYSQWVKENVVPHLLTPPTWIVQLAKRSNAAAYLEEFFSGDDNIEVITDWPDDIKYFCEELIVGPGEMVKIPGIRFQVVRVDAYPTTLEGAVQHNAWWDAMALKVKLENL
jgi:hypothetical protein